MADVEARREARRRKILQNSENRLNRLLGKPTVDDNAGPVGSVDPGPGEGAHLGDADVVRNTTTPSCPSPPAETAPGVIQDIQAEGELSSSASTVRQRLPRTVPTTDRESAPQTVPLAERSSATALGPSPVDRTKSGLSEGPAKEDSTDPLRLLNFIRCGGCLLAAFFTRWALRFGLGLLFLEWVLIPFLVLEGSLFYFQKTHMKDITLPHKSSMMTYALVLSGVRQDIVSKYSMIMGYISAVTEDFALFLFAFLVCHVVVT